jgi:hypothetical protein
VHGEYCIDILNKLREIDDVYYVDCDGYNSDARFRKLITKTIATTKIVVLLVDNNRSMTGFIKSFVSNDMSFTKTYERYIPIANIIVVTNNIEQYMCGSIQKRGFYCKHNVCITV